MFLWGRTESLSTFVSKIIVTYLRFASDYFSCIIDLAFSILKYYWRTFFFNLLYTIVEKSKEQKNIKENSKIRQNSPLLNFAY